LASIAWPLQKDAALREAAEARILIAAADRAIHENGVSRSSLSQGARVVRRSAFHLLPGFCLLALFARLIVEEHLLEPATARGRTAGSSGRGSLRRAAILASFRWASATRSIARKPAAKFAPATSIGRTLPWRLRIVAAIRRRRLCRRICGCYCRSLAGVLCRGRSFDAFERRNFERHVDRARAVPKIKFLGGIIKTE
jgi:hypothetical protein